MILERLKITDTFKQWRDKINLIIDGYSGVPSTDLETGIITISTETIKAQQFIVKIPTTFTDDVTFENVTINGTLDANVESANRLTVPVEINGTLFDGSQNITTPQWGVARTINIGDYDKSNFGESISVDGSKNYTLSLPKVIKADITGTSDYASQLKNTVNVDGINFNGSSNVIHYCTCESNSGSQVKQVTLDNFKLVYGATITVQFINGNTVSEPQLNVNNTGNVPIYSKNGPADHSVIMEHSIITFVYDGRVFNIVSGEDTKVLQQKSNTDKEYPLLFSSLTDVSVNNVTSNSLYSSGLLVNPSTNQLTLDGWFYTKSGYGIKNINDSWNTIPAETTINTYVQYQENSGRSLSRFEFQKDSDGTVLSSIVVPKHNASGEESTSYLKVGWNAGTTPVIKTNSNIIAEGTITGSKVYNAVWNDYAEFFQKGEETEPGDIIALDESSKIERYIRATNKSKLIVGVHSDTYGHILGGECSIEESMKKYIPVGMTGRVYVNFIGEAILGEAVVPSEIPGVGKLYDERIDDKQRIVGYIVEDESDDTKLRKVKILITK